MLAWDILKFLKKYGEPGIVIGDPQRSFDFFFDIINSGQVVLINDDKGLAAAALYLRVRNLDEIRQKRGTFLRMRNFRHGNIVYVHTVVVRPDLKNKGMIWKLAKQIRDKELLCDRVAFTFNKNERWTYKIERRRNTMRDNCGIIALDELLKSLNLNMSRISLDTLSKICRDNGRLMFPLRVPKDKLSSINMPYILQTNNHYEVIEDDTALLGLDIGDNAYLLSPTLHSSAIDYVIDEEEAKEVKGAGGGLKQYYSKPARLLPMLGSTAGTMLGVGPTMTNMIGTGIGALQGGTTGLWGKGNVAGGAMQGFGQSLLGRGVGQGFNNWLTPSNPATGSLQGGPTFNEGFMSGIGQAMPFKNVINKGLNQQFFTPMDDAGVKVMGANVPGAAAWQPIETPTSVPNMNWGTPATLPSGDTGYFNPTNGSFTSSAVLNSAGGMLSPTAAPGTIAAPATAANQGLLQKMGPSAALMLAGQLIPEPKYDVPNAADVYTSLINSGQIPQTSGPLGAAAQAATLKNINSPDTILSNQIEPYKAAINADLDAREQEELAFIRTVHAQNGTSGGSDEMRDIQKVQEKYRNYKTEQLGAIDQNLYNQKVSIYLSSIADAYGMDQANLQTLAGLTGTTISEAATKYGIKAQQVKDFRDAIYQLAVSAAPGAQSTTASSLLSKLFAQ